MQKGKKESTGSEEEKASSDEDTFQGTSKGVTRERHSTSHKVIFVDNLPPSMDKQGFIEMFQKFGEILDVKYLKHKTGPETGFGFIEFANGKNGRKAIKDYNWKKVENRIIRVSRAKPSTNKLSGTNLYVENIPVDWNDQTLYDHVSRICDITGAKILMDEKKGVSRGVGFLHCASNEEAKKAIRWFANKGRAKNGLKLNVKFAKIPRASRTAPKAECQVQQKRSNNQSSKDVGNTAFSRPKKDSEPRLQESKNNEMQSGKRAEKNWYKYNSHPLLSHNKSLELPSGKKLKTLSKSKRRKQLRRKNRQLSRAIKRGTQKSAKSNFNDNLNTNSNWKQLVKTSKGPTICEKPIPTPTIPVADRAGNKHVEQYVRIQMPNTNIPKSNPPAQFFMNQQYKTAQVAELGGNIVGNCVVDSTQANHMSSQATFPVMCNAQPYEYALLVNTSTSSIQSSPLGPTPMTPCTSMHTQNSNVQANTMYYSGLPVPYTQWQPLNNPKDKFGCKKDLYQNGLVGVGASRAEFGRQQMNVNPQIGVGHSYYWPESQFLAQVVNTSGFPVQAQQQVWPSSESCASMDSFSTANEDFYYNPMNQVISGGMIQYANVQPQNRIFQTNRAHCSESNQFNTTSSVQYAPFVFGEDLKSDTTSITSDITSTTLAQSEIGGQPFQCQSEICGQQFQCHNVFKATRSASPAEKMGGNHIIRGNDCNIGGKSYMTRQQQGVNPQPHITHEVIPVGIGVTNLPNWVNLISSDDCSETNGFAKQPLKKEPAFPQKSVKVTNLPIEVNVISSNNCLETIGFNHQLDTNKGPGNRYKRKSKTKKNRFSRKAKNNNRFSVNMVRNDSYSKPAACSNEKWKVTKSPFMGFNRKPKMVKGKGNFYTNNFEE